MINQRSFCAAILVCVTALALTACGASARDQELEAIQADQTAVAHVAANYLGALVDRDFATLCSLLDPQALEQFLQGSSCEEAMSGSLPTSAQRQRQIETMQISPKLIVIEADLATIPQEALTYEGKAPDELMFINQFRKYRDQWYVADTPAQRSSDG